MGVIYSIACKDCKVTRDLDKFYTPRKIESRVEALEYSEEVKEDAFRAGLLLSFLAEHRGHDCVFFSSRDGCCEELDPVCDGCDFREDTDFWNV